MALPNPTQLTLRCHFLPLLLYSLYSTSAYFLFPQHTKQPYIKSLHFVSPLLATFCPVALDPSLPLCSNISLLKTLPFLITLSKIASVVPLSIPLTWFIFLNSNYRLLNIYLLTDLFIVFKV